MKNKTAISLFASGGIGDLAVRAANWDVLVANELLVDRAEVFKKNYPETLMIQGDIRVVGDQIISETKRLLNGRVLDLLFATPPCQGMSKNGRGKLLRGIRDGLKPKLDERNQLILNAVNCIKSLNPRLVVFENVPEMENTVIESRNGELVNLLDYVKEELSPKYNGSWEVVEFADFGVPQRRKRLITIFTQNEFLKKLLDTKKTLLPSRTHSKEASLMTSKWVSVSEALLGVPQLDASEPSRATSNIKFHSVPILDKDKYFWVSSTPPNKGAFDNQCVNPKCRFQGNPTHRAEHNDEGINQAKKDTPVRCEKCDQLLPRPWVIENNEHRIMSGFTSAYKRMSADLPASALTSNLSYACSDQKIHPTEHRVLSLYEAFILHTISDFSFCWERLDNKKLSDKTIREIIGESIPPRGLKIIFDYLRELELLSDQSNQKQHRPDLKGFIQDQISP